MIAEVAIVSAACVAIAKLNLDAETARGHAARIVERAEDAMRAHVERAAGMTARIDAVASQAQDVTERVRKVEGRLIGIEQRVTR